MWTSPPGHSVYGASVGGIVPWGLIGIPQALQRYIFFVPRGYATRVRMYFPISRDAETYNNIGETHPPTRLLPHRGARSRSIVGGRGGALREFPDRGVAGTIVGGRGGGTEGIPSEAYPPTSLSWCARSGLCARWVVAGGRAAPLRRFPTGANDMRDRNEFFFLFRHGYRRWASYAGGHHLQLPLPQELELELPIPTNPQALGEFPQRRTLPNVTRAARAADYAPGG